MSEDVAESKVAAVELQTENPEKVMLEVAETVNQLITLLEENEQKPPDEIHEAIAEVTVSLEIQVPAEMSKEATEPEKDVFVRPKGKPKKSKSKSTSQKKVPVAPSVENIFNYYTKIYTTVHSYGTGAEYIFAVTVQDEKDLVRWPSLNHQIIWDIIKDTRREVCQKGLRNLHVKILLESNEFTFALKTPFLPVDLFNTSVGFDVIGRPKLCQQFKLSMRFIGTEDENERLFPDEADGRWNGYDKFLYSPNGVGAYGISRRAPSSWHAQLLAENVIIDHCWYVMYYDVRILNYENRKKKEMQKKAIQGIVTKSVYDAKLFLKATKDDPLLVDLVVEYGTIGRYQPEHILPYDVFMENIDQIFHVDVGDRFLLRVFTHVLPSKMIFGEPNKNEFKRGNVTEASYGLTRVYRQLEYKNKFKPSESKCSIRDCFNYYEQGRFVSADHVEVCYSVQEKFMLVLVNFKRWQAFAWFIADLIYDMFVKDAYSQKNEPNDTNPTFTMGNCLLELEILQPRGLPLHVEFKELTDYDEHFFKKTGFFGDGSYRPNETLKMRLHFARKGKTDEPTPSFWRPGSENLGDILEGMHEECQMRNIVDSYESQIDSIREFGAAEMAFKDVGSCFSYEEIHRQQWARHIYQKKFLITLEDPEDFAVASVEMIREQFHHVGTFFGSDFQVSFEICDLDDLPRITMEFIDRDDVTKDLIIHKGTDYERTKKFLLETTYTSLIPQRNFRLVDEIFDGICEPTEIQTPFLRFTNEEGYVVDEYERPLHFQANTEGNAREYDEESIKLALQLGGINLEDVD